jgi:Bacterial Ig domain
MKTLALVAIFTLATTCVAVAQDARCATTGSFTWGYNAVWSGSIKSGQACRASYASNFGSYLGHKIVSQPRNGTLRVAGVSNGVPTFVYQPKAGFSGSDTFTVELTGASINRQTGTAFPPANTQITYNMTVAP